MKQLLVIAALAIVIATVAGCHKPKEEDDYCQEQVDSL